MDDPTTTETTGTDAGASAPVSAPAADTAPVETTVTEQAAAPAEPEATAPDAEVAAAETTPPAEPAPVTIPEEVQAQVDALQAEQAAWGPQWEIRDDAREVVNSFLTKGGDATIDALLAVSPTRTYELINAILEASAARHVATEHGISPQELATLLGPPPDIPMTREIERAIDAMPDEDAADAVREVWEQNALLKRQLADAQGVAKQVRQEVQSAQEQQSIQTFVSDFAGWQGELMSELVEEVPERQRQSVMTVTKYTFVNDPAAIDAVAAYSAAVTRGENEKILKSTFLPPVKEALRRVMAAELVDVRGFKPKSGPAKAPTKTGPKLIGATPGAKPGATPAPTAAVTSERHVAPHHSAALRIAADIANARAARRSGA